MKELGIYIHIPFCKKKCDYCDFVSYCDKNDMIEKYVNSVKNEIANNVGANLVRNAEKEYRNTPLDNNYQITTIYIGGGTPSSIDSKYIVEILNTIKTNVGGRSLRRPEN